VLPTLGRAGRGAQEAYAALTANPVPERRLEALHWLLCCQLLRVG
jgi:hypothetical protein